MHMHARTHSPGSGSIVLPTTARARVRELCFDPPTVFRVISRKFQDYNISRTRSIYTFRQQANLSPSGRGTRRRRRLRVSRVNGDYKGKSITGGKPHTQCTCMHAHTKPHTQCTCMHAHTKPHTQCTCMHAHTHQGLVPLSVPRQHELEFVNSASTHLQLLEWRIENYKITILARQEAYLSAASQLVALWPWHQEEKEETESVQSQRVL